VRHHLVQRIIRAYDEHKTRAAEDQMSQPDWRSNGKSHPASDPSPGPQTPNSKPAVSPTRTQADE
jgi:hypothetical protein